jgi:hypothetical protein
MFQLTAALPRMIAIDDPLAERVARDLLELDGADAARIAQERAATAGDRQMTELWRRIAEAVKGLMNAGSR